MLNPPEILKLKEPLFKYILINDNSLHINDPSTNDPYQQFNMQQHHHQQQHRQQNKNAQIFSIHNLNFELNIRSNKGQAEQDFVEFANVWVYLAFFKYSQNTLRKHFGMHTIQLIMDHDRPVPNTYSVLFDMKTTLQYMAHEMMKNSVRNNQQQTTISGVYLNHMNTVNYFFIQLENLRKLYILLT
jgi:hypothetical protein